MQEFFFEVGLQDILFRNHPAPPPQNINGLLYTKKGVIAYDLWDKWMTSFNHVNFSLKNTISFQNVQQQFSFEDS